jgi:CheY-like chemotaxis protein
MHPSAIDLNISETAVPEHLRADAFLGARNPAPSILVIDDEPIVARMIAHVAEECGYRARFTINAAAFRAQYGIEPSDIVLLDLSLPGGDGIELLRFLAEQGSTSAIFIVSGFDRRVLEAAQRLGEGLGLNMGGTLTKPVFVRDLEGALAGADHLLATNGGGRHDRRVCLGA